VVVPLRKIYEKSLSGTIGSIYWTCDLGDKDLDRQLEAPLVMMNLYE
jgi:hypothetical protein